MVKRLRKGHSTLLIDGEGFPRDATGHRTDLPPRYNHLGKRLWYAEELTYALGERVRAVKGWHRMEPGDLGTVLTIPEYVRREYLILPDKLMKQFMRTRSGLYLSRMPEHFLEPE
jgi:hypothetical protein